MKYNIGIDIGSTTMKFAVLNDKGELVFNCYQRHNADITGTAVTMAKKLQEKVGDITFSLTLTGSVGMGYAQRMGWSFEQEVVAAVQAIEWQHPCVGMLIDTGSRKRDLVLSDRRKSVQKIRISSTMAAPRPIHGHTWKNML